MRAIRDEPQRVVDLYEQLYRGEFVAIVQRGSETSLESMLFLTYESAGGIMELPVFTMEEFVLPRLLADSFRVKLQGPELWPRLLDIVEAGRCEAAVDPGQPHGIRLRRDMILGMVGKYGSPPA